MRNRPDLLVLIAIWEFLTAFVATIGVAAIAIFAIPAVTGNWDYGWGGMGGDWGRSGDMGMVGAVFGLSVAILVLACFIAFGVAAGIGLLSGKNWGRMMGIVHSALSIFWVPVGTVIGVLAIIYLTKDEVKQYFSPAPPTASP